MRGAHVGRDVGRDDSRDQAAWRELVARLEFAAPMDPTEAPWPDRENLRAKAPRVSPTPDDVSELTGDGPPPSEASTVSETAAESDPQAKTEGERSPDHRAPANGRRVIRPAGFPRFYQPVTDPSAPDDENVDAPWELAAPPPGPRDYAVDDPRPGDLDDLYDDDRYIPPPVGPQPKLDPVTKGAWLVLFGGPGYLLLASLLDWVIPGWAALASVAAFVSGFVILVIKLGDGPSKRDGPDQGAVV
jgi:hypothetical protein